MTPWFSSFDRPRPEETVLTGGWIVVGDSRANDATTLRINRLLEDYLIRVSVSDDGWDTLYRDPSDGRLWEHIYPHDGVRVGGAAILRVIADGDARERYRVDSPEEDE